MSEIIGIDDLLFAKPEPIEANGDELAEWLNLSSRQVARLANDGRAVRLGRNRFDLKASVRAYCEWMRDQVPAGSPGRGGDARTKLAYERQRLVREQADSIALKNAQTRAEFVHAADVERTWASTLRTVRSAMLAVPSRVHARLSHLSLDEVNLIDREVRDALVETANGECFEQAATLDD